MGRAFLFKFIDKGLMAATCMACSRTVVGRVTGGGLELTGEGKLIRVAKDEAGAVG